MGRDYQGIDSVVDSGGDLWSGSFVCAAAYRCYKVAAGKGDSGFFDRDYADYVYSGGSRTFGYLGCSTDRMGKNYDYDTCFHCACHGRFRSGNAVDDEKERRMQRGRKSMKEFVSDSVFFGVFMTLATYEAGMFLKKKTRSALCNPMLISIVAIILFLLAFQIDYTVYNEGAHYISYLLTPATVALAVPLYEQFSKLKENAAAIMAGLAAGVLTSLCSILVMAKLAGLNHELYVTMLPKSITTAIGMGVSEELGGVVTITIAVIVITGIVGNVFAELICRLFHITEPVAKGIAIGSASHALGTAKAMEIGEVEGAMSSLSIAVAGILTVIGANLFAGFM